MRKFWGILRVQERMRGRWKDKLYLGLLFLFGYFLFFWRLGSPALYDLDEGGYAETAREMLVLNDWITPHRNFVRLLDKPPLLYWLTSISYRLFGISELSSRLPVAGSTIGCMLLCYWMGARLFSREAGFFSAFIFSTSAGVLILGVGRQLLPDMLFTFFITATFALLISGHADPAKRERYTCLAWCAMALAVMTKGWIGVIFPLLAILGYGILSRETGWFRQLQWLKGGLLFLGLVLPWHLLAELKTPGFLKFYLWDVHAGRFFHQGSLAAEDYTSFSLLSFWGVTAFWFSPWVVFLPLAFLQGFPARLRNLALEDKASLWLWLWAGAVLAFFSLSFYRMDNYGLPAIPALSLIMGRFWAGLTAKEERPWLRWGMVSSTSFLALVSVVPITISILEFSGALSPLFPALSQYLKETIFDDKVAYMPIWGNLQPLFSVGGGATMVGVASLVLASLWRRFDLVFAMIVLVMIPVSYCTHRAETLFEPYLSCKSLADRINRDLQAGQKVVIVKEGRYEDIATVGFYTGQKIYLLNGRSDDLLFGSRYPDGSEVFLDEKRFVNLWGSPQEVYLLTERPVSAQKARRALDFRWKLYPVGQSWRFHLYTNHDRNIRLSGKPQV